MATKIGNSQSPYSLQRVNLSGKIFTLVLKYSKRSDSWHVDIKSSDGSTAILTGLKVVPNQSLTGRYQPNPLPGGNLWCLRRQDTGDKIGRYNLGPDKPYALYWLTPEEEEEFNPDDRISV